MDVAATPEQEIRGEVTSRNRICIVIAVMACIVSGSFILLGVSLKRNDELVSILDQYHDYIKHQLPPNAVNGGALAAAPSNTAVLPRQPQPVKHAVRRVNGTRQDETQLMYLNAPETTNFTRRSKIHHNYSSSTRRHHGRDAPDKAHLAVPGNVQQQIEEASASVLPRTTSAPPPTLANTMRTNGSSISPSPTKEVQATNHSISNSVKHPRSFMNVTSLPSSDGSGTSTPKGTTSHEMPLRNTTRSKIRQIKSETTRFVELPRTTSATTHASSEYEAPDDGSTDDSGDNLDAVIVTAFPPVVFAAHNSSSRIPLRNVSHTT